MIEIDGSRPVLRWVWTAALAALLGPAGLAALDQCPAGMDLSVPCQQVCGDGICSGTETCAGCPDDCSNGICDGAENCST